MRKLKGLEEAIGVTVVDPVRDERGWAFRDGPGYSRDPINGFRFLSEAYAADAIPNFDGRVTVPVLWDKQTRRIVNNSEDDICRMFNDAFNAFAKPRGRSFPGGHRGGAREALRIYLREREQRRLSGRIRDHARRPTRKRAARCSPRSTNWRARLATSRYLFGNRIVEADWRLFCTLIRFDAVYHGHFKCNLRRIVDYPNLRAICGISTSSPASPRR